MDLARNVSPFQRVAAVQHDGTYLVLWLLMVFLAFVVPFSRIVSPASDLLPRYGILHGRHGGLDWMD